MIDKRVPQSMIALRNMEKRVRKYEGALWIISHATSDFLSPEIKQYGQALFDLPTYKLFFGTDGEALKDLQTLFTFSEAELDLLQSKSRGKALAVFGSKRLQVNFDIPKYKFEYFGNKGGR